MLNIALPIDGSAKRRSRELNKREIPISTEPINIRYSNDYPIDELDQKIKLYLSEGIRIKELKKKLDILYQEFKLAETAVLTMQIAKKINRYIEIINQCKDFQEYNNYINETQKYIEEYKKLSPYQGEDIINEDQNYPDEQDILRLTLIKRYLNKASDYYPLNIMCVNKSQTVSCQNCGFDMSSVDTQSQGTIDCPECSALFKSENLIDFSTKTVVQCSREYDASSTIRREYDEFQGKERLYIDPEIFDLLDTYFISIGVGSSTKIRQLPLNKYGKREGTSRKMLDTAFKEIGRPEFYKHCNKIGREYWGWELRDLGDKTAEFMNAFRETQSYFPLVKKKGRTSNVCSQYRLMQELIHIGVDVCIDEFKLPGMDSCIRSEKIYKQMAEMAGRKIPLFFTDETFSFSSGGLLIELKTTADLI